MNTEQYLCLHQDQEYYPRHQQHHLHRQIFHILFHLNILFVKSYIYVQKFLFLADENIEVNEDSSEYVYLESLLILDPEVTNHAYHHRTQYRHSFLQ